MKLFVLLNLMICLGINDDNILSAMGIRIVQHDDDLKDLRKELEKVLKVGIKKLDEPKYGEWAVNDSVYVTDKKEYLFVKENSTIGSDKLFRGEFESLNAILDTKTILAPRPIATGTTKEKNNFLVLEYLNMESFNNISSEELGDQLADLHLYNLQGKQPVVKKFGFHVDTKCGTLLQNNTWTADWTTFFLENRLSHQIKLMETMKPGVMTNVIEFCWSVLKPLVPDFFEGLDIKPSLLHGNLKAENVGQLGLEPVTLNPAAFYGHHEYDLAVATYLGNFSSEFFEAYHAKIPKTPRFEDRIELYYLFFLLNDWNQGLSEGSRIIDTIEEIVNKHEENSKKKS